MKPYDPLCERCLKLQNVEVAVVAVELCCGTVSLCTHCADIVEEDGGVIKGCNESGYSLNPRDHWYK
jgi:hypothetical protein